jgi:release factor glutamine methyltransferase
VTHGTLLREATARLAAVSDTPRLDAEILLAHALGLTRTQLLGRLRDAAEAPGLEALLQRRLDHEPVAYILGTWEFYALDFACRAPLLVPRPETEHLVEAALAHLKEQPGPVLDLCTGTGCVAISIACHAPAAAWHATDRNPAAIALARENAEHHGIDLALHQGDLFAALPAGLPPFAAVVANPPYVEDAAWPTLSPVITRHEDPGALLAGPDGLDCIRRIVAEAPAHLAPGGLLALEMGEAQWPAVRALLEQAGFHGIGVLHDLAGIPRVARATR